MKGLFLSHALRYVLPVLLALAFMGSARAQVTEHKLTASDGAVNDEFGYSVSLSGDRALVGVRQDDVLGSRSGPAYVYDLGALPPTESVALGFVGKQISLSPFIGPNLDQNRLSFALFVEKIRQVAIQTYTSAL